MVEEADARADVIGARPVQVDLDADLGFLGVALNARLPHGGLSTFAGPSFITPPAKGPAAKARPSLGAQAGAQVGAQALDPPPRKLGSASCRDRVCQYV